MRSTHAMGKSVRIVQEHTLLERVFRGALMVSLQKRGAMDSVELRISPKDWLYIVIIGALFGLLISLFFYFPDPALRIPSTILFSVFVSICISLFSVVLITISNNLILPRVNKRFWYLVSFVFSFLSGALGFLSGFVVFRGMEIPIVGLVAPYTLPIAATIGLMTFLVGVILHQFISMKYRHESIKTEKLTAQIKALENELSPHFLFNTLNSISELIYTDQRKAEDTVLSLSKFLRNALDQKESLVSLGEELEMLRTYVDIENVRFGDRIRLHIDIDPEALGIKVPKFSIQLLVENGIKHGYIGDKLNFWISCADGVITVANDGKKCTKVIFGTGLSNLRDRLKLLDIGRLEYDTEDRMRFMIKLGEKE